MRYKENIVVVGAGISGLSCAYRLKQLAVPALVLEAKERAGGVIKTERRNGYVFELGPQCPRFPGSVQQLMFELGLEQEFVAGNPRAKRYILSRGRLHLAPLSWFELISTQAVGISSKFRILTEVLHHSCPPEGEETLAEFVQRKFGAEVLGNLVEPFVSTIFFGDCYRMGMDSAFPMLVKWEREHGSVARGALRTQQRKSTSNGSPSSSAGPNRKPGNSAFHLNDALPTLGSFRSGMGALPERLAEHLEPRIRYRTTVACITREQNTDDAATGWQLAMSTGETIEARHLVLAVPAFVAAKLLDGSVPDLSALLKQIEYAPLRGASMVYERAQVSHSLDGFGFMVPRREGMHTICTFWNSSLFPSRAPEKHVLFTSFAREVAASGAQANGGENWAAAVEAENRRILGVSGEPLERLGWEDPTALPQYNVGHARRVSEINAAVQLVPNLHLIGNFLQGRSIKDCIELAFRAAENLHSRLGNSHI